MIKPLTKCYKGLITITGPTRSGKSQLAEFLIKDQEFVTYIATSKPRGNDSDWQQRINIHRERRPDFWNLIEHPIDICESIKSVGQPNRAILIDSLGGLVEHHILKSNVKWEIFQNKFVNSITNKPFFIIVVAEEVGWGVVPSTPVGNLFRERLSTLTSLISRVSSQRWLAINGTAIDLDKVGESIP